MNSRGNGGLLHVKEVAPHFDAPHDAGLAVSRIPVPGGWVVISTVVAFGDGGETISSSSTFVSDPNHEWRIDQGGQGGS